VDCLAACSKAQYGCCVAIIIGSQRCYGGDTMIQSSKKNWIATTVCSAAAPATSDSDDGDDDGDDDDDAPTPSLAPLPTPSIPDTGSHIDFPKIPTLSNPAGCAKPCLFGSWKCTKTQCKDCSLCKIPGEIRIFKDIQWSDAKTSYLLDVYTDGTSGGRALMIFLGNRKHKGNIGGNLHRLGCQWLYCVLHESQTERSEWCLRMGL